MYNTAESTNVQYKLSHYLKEYIYYIYIYMLAIIYIYIYIYIYKLVKLYINLLKKYFCEIYFVSENINFNVKDL